VRASAHRATRWFLSQFAALVIYTDFLCCLAAASSRDRQAAVPTRSRRWMSGSLVWSSCLRCWPGAASCCANVCWRGHDDALLDRPDHHAWPVGLPAVRDAQSRELL